MSMPSSSALVVTTPSRSPLARSRSISRRWLRRVAGAVGRHTVGVVGVVLQPLARELVDQLGGAAAAREADRAHFGRDQVGEQAGCLAEAGCAAHRALVEQRRVAHHDLALAALGAVAVDEVELEPGQLLRERQRVRDRRRGEHEPRLRAVGLREPAQPAQHVGHVRAEHSPVHVRLVHDHQREVREEVAPARVVGQDPDVQHVGVREHDVGALADRGALLLRRVAVVDRVVQGRRARARSGCAPGPARAPWSDTGRAPARGGRRPARAAPAG